MGIDQFLNVSYKLISSDKFEEYLEAMGVADDVKNAICSQTPVLTMSREGGAYKFTSASSFRDHVTTFTPGVECENVGIDGRSYTCNTTIEDNKVIHNIMSEPQSKIVSEFTNDKLFITLTTGPVTSTRVFEKI